MVAGHIIDRTGLTSTFIIVPTRMLVDHVVQELARQVPDVAIGTFCGEGNLVVADGINVITYAMLQSGTSSSTLVSSRQRRSKTPIGTRLRVSRVKREFASAR